MRIHTLPMSLRGMMMLAFAVGFALAVVDGGSVVLTRLTVPDDVQAAGHAAAEVAKNGPANRQTAAAAHRAAQDTAKPHGIIVHTKDFTIYADGRVTLTAGKTAPTLLLERVPQLAHLADVTTTTTVEPLPFS